MKHSIEELKYIETYLDSEMKYGEFRNFFHEGNRKGWDYIDSFFDWIVSNPVKVRELKARRKKEKLEERVKEYCEECGCPSEICCGKKKEVKE